MACSNKQLTTEKSSQNNKISSTKATFWVANYKNAKQSLSN
jgi:hypothetical protein